MFQDRMKGAEVSWTYCSNCFMYISKLHAYQHFFVDIFGSFSDLILFVRIINFTKYNKYYIFNFSFILLTYSNVYMKFSLLKFRNRQLFQLVSTCISTYLSSRRIETLWVVSDFIIFFINPYNSLLSYCRMS